MSYQVLARKWRPRNFSTLVGQEHVVRALTHALSQQRLHHAYLFTGTRGVGKTTVARILAKALNCQAGITSTPCGQCAACTEIDAGRFVDLLEVDAATNTKVDEMRQLLENAVYAPTRGRFKVYVIDEVHMLSTSAFNAMLKTLEEPPEHVKFILATTDPQKIPVTVLSRCLQFNLKQMTVAGIAAHLAHILQAEDIPFDPSALSLIARGANGSMRDALSLLDQAIAHGAGQIQDAGVRAMLGSIDGDYLYSMLEALSEGNASAMVAIAATLAVRSLSFSTALQDLAGLLITIQLAQLVPGSLDQDDPDRERISRLVDAFSPEFVQLAYQIVIAGRAEIATAPDEYAGFLMTLLRLHAFRPHTVSEAISVLPKQLRPNVAVQSTSVRTEQSLPAEPLPIDKSLNNPDWGTLLGQLGLTGLTRELAANCELVRLADQECILRLPAARAHLQMKPAPERIQSALSNYLDRKIHLKIEIGDVLDTPAEQADRNRLERQTSAKNSIEHDPFVCDAVESLQATIIDSSIKPLA